MEIQSVSAFAPMSPSPLVMLSPMNSIFKLRSGTGRNSPSVSTALICKTLSGSAFMACVSLKMRTFLIFSGSMPRNTHTRSAPFCAMRREKNSPFTIKLYHGSWMSQSAVNSTHSSLPRTLSSKPAAVQNSVSGVNEPFVRPCTRCGTSGKVYRLTSLILPPPRQAPSYKDTCQCLP